MARRKRVTWDNQNTKRILELCIQFKVGSSGCKTKWAKIAQELNVETGNNFSGRQARKKYFHLKGQFGVWNEMEIEFPGLAFDPETECPLVEQDARWAEFVEKHKGMPSRFLKKPLPYLSLLRLLYTSSSASSKFSYSPGCGSGAALFGKNDINEGEEIGDNDYILETGFEGKKYDYDYEESKSPPASISKRKRKVEQSVGWSKRIKDAIDHCLEILKRSLNSKHFQVVAALNNLKPIQDKGEDFVFQCIQFLRESDNGDYFLALRSNWQKLLFLKTKFEIDLGSDESPMEVSI